VSRVENTVLKEGRKGNDFNRENHARGDPKAEEKT
jgi:hypothetical protein